MHKYLPHTKEDIDLMLNKIGIKKIEDLTDYIDKDLLYKKSYGIPSQTSDLELTKELINLSKQNKELTIFRGYGAYDVYTPSVNGALTSRQEFLTSYTPYQPEVSQGTLQYIFEYQSMICEITDMDVTNASMYDGPSATSEALFMAVAHTNRNKVLYSKLLHPRTIEVLQTYAKYRGIKLIELPERDGLTDLNHLSQKLDDVAAVLIQSPNVYGHIE